MGNRLQYVPLSAQILCEILARLTPRVFKASEKVPKGGRWNAADPDQHFTDGHVPEGGLTARWAGRFDNYNDRRAFNRTFGAPRGILIEAHEFGWMSASRHWDPNTASSCDFYHSRHLERGY